MQPTQPDPSETTRQAEDTTSEATDSTQAAQPGLAGKLLAGIKWLLFEPEKPTDSQEPPAAPGEAPSQEMPAAATLEAAPAAPAPAPTPQEPPAAPASDQMPPPLLLIAPPTRAEPAADESDALQQLRAAKPWLHIWLHPARTMRQLLALNPPNVVVLLAMLSGINTLLDLLLYALPAATGSMWLSPLILLLAGLVLGALFGFGMLYFWGSLLHWTASWMGGQAAASSVRAAFAWAAVPRIASIVLVLPHILLLFIGNETLLFGLLLIYALLEAVAYLWSLVLLVACLGEASRLSGVSALAAVLLAGFFVFTPLFILWAIISMAWIMPPPPPPDAGFLAGLWLANF